MPRRARDTRKPAPTSAMVLLDDAPPVPGSYERCYTIEYTPEGGGRFVGTLEEVNALLTALGYHEIAVRYNLMSHVAYIEAKGTPIYLSPASETYWSM